MKTKNFKEEHFLKISIIDTGNGIKERNIKFLFNDEIKADINKDYNSEGSKLGLSICLNLAKILNLKIEYFSEENLGSIFSLIIPAKKITKANREMRIISLARFRTLCLMNFPLRIYQ